jgi:hypothetical protein
MKDMEQINDVWQVMVEGQVYESDFDGLVQWHTEGCFHPTDMVRKGNRGWIEAYKVPQLQRIFNSAPLIMPVQPPAPSVTANYQPAHNVQAFQQPTNQANSFSGNVVNPAAAQGAPTQSAFNAGGGGGGSTYQQQQYQTNHQQHQPHGNYQQQAHSQQQYQQQQYHQHSQQNGWIAPPPPQNFVSDNCATHQHIPAKYICRACSALLCNDCPKKMGMSVFICPHCGAMCELYEQLRKKREMAFRKSQGFGFEDLGVALTFPLKFPASLIGGALLYAIFLFGGLIGWLLSYMLIFGCMVVIIRQVAWGRMERNFIASIGENGVLDDLIKPGFLGFGVTLISWGPALIGAVIAIYLALSAASGALQRQSLPENQPPVFQMQTQPQSGRNDRSAQNNSPATDKYAEKERTIYETEGMPEKQQRQANTSYARSVLAAAIPLVLLIGLGLLWGFFYYPMALAIAGYTQDFLSVINPLVGLDTMKRMGVTYFKAFGMYIIVMIIQGALGFVVGIITMPFNTPFGNIPQNLIGGTITFYSSMVIACLLGLALFKCSDKLGIETD